MIEKSNQDKIVSELLKLIPISFIMSDEFVTACANSRYKFYWNYAHLKLLSIDVIDFIDVRTEEQKAEDSFIRFYDFIFQQGNKVVYDLVVFVVSHYCENENKKIDLKGLRLALREIGISEFVELNRYDADIPLSNIVETEVVEWQEVKDDIVKIETDSCIAEKIIDYQNIGNSCRVLLIKVAKLVYDKEIHGALNKEGKKIGPSDAGGMLENYFSYKLVGEKMEKLRAYAKSTNNLANELTHKSTATKQLMQITVSATIHLIYLIGIIDDKLGHG